MKAAARKTKPDPSACIPHSWYGRPDKPMGYCELRLNERVVATVEAKLVYTIRFRTWDYDILDWPWRVLGKDGTVLAEGVSPHQVVARDKAYAAAERFRKRGLI